MAGFGRLRAMNARSGRIGRWEIRLSHRYFSCPKTPANCYYPNWQPQHYRACCVEMNYMKTALLLLIGLGLLLLGSSTALADKANGPKAKLFAKYDKNKNGIIDGEEKDALRKDYAADPQGDLKRFDTNNNGKLEDDEIAAIKPPAGKKKASEKSGKDKDTTQKTDKAKTEKSKEAPEK